MQRHIASRSSLPIALLVAAITSASAQSRGFDLTYGRWWSDSASVAYSLSYFSDLVGPLSCALGVTHLQQTKGERTRRTGGELTAALWRDGAGLYLVGGAGLSMGHADGLVDAQWSAGGGYAVRPLRFFSVALEGRYRVADRRIRGFWQLQPDDERGLILQLRMALGAGGGRNSGRAARRSESESFDPPAPAEIESETRSDGAAELAAALRGQVVQTALDAMGSPYRWGGSDSNGFDCSGLIQYAYGEHGIILPRMSRDQARMGMQVEMDLQSLAPGDILGFNNGGGGVTHVGLYVGDGMFIHSASSGVKLTSLRADDGEARWWRERWVSVRRVIN